MNDDDGWARGAAPEVPVAVDVGAFSTVRLDQIGAAGLMRRVDTKYVFDAGALATVLDGLAPAYRVLEVAGHRQHSYLTLYFDTAALELFAAHHRGVGERFKVRERLYGSTRQLFVEVKHRDNAGVTDKQRFAAEAWSAALEPAALACLTARNPWRVPDLRLAPSLWNAYQRITLVAEDPPERVTLDTNLRFMAAGGRRDLGGVAIAEVKQPRLDRRSPFMQRMRDLGLRHGGLSKYCMGVCLLRPEIKHNRFKPRLRAVERVGLGSRHVA